MQIRERGQKIVLLRSEYIPERKRAVAKQVASFDRYNDKIPRDIAEKLSLEEKREVQEWLDDRARNRTVASQEYALTKLPETIRDAIKAIESESGAMKLSRIGFADDLVDALDELKKALRKNGIMLTKSKQTKKSNDDNEQSDMLADFKE